MEKDKFKPKPVAIPYINLSTSSSKKITIVLVIYCPANTIKKVVFLINTIVLKG